MDYYKILNIPHQADESQIKQAYRKLAKRYYPDLNPYNPETEARFKDIVEAYETLGDPAKCRKYDANMIQSSATMGTEPKAQKAALCRCRAGRQLWQFYKGYGALFRILISGRPAGRKTEPGKRRGQKQEKSAGRDRHVRGVYEDKVRGGANHEVFSIRYR